MSELLTDKTQVPESLYDQAREVIDCVPDYNSVLLAHSNDGSLLLLSADETAKIKRCVEASRKFREAFSGASVSLFIRT